MAPRAPAVTGLEGSACVHGGLAGTSHSPVRGAGKRDVLPSCGAHDPVGRLLLMTPPNHQTARGGWWGEGEGERCWCRPATAEAGSGVDRCMGR